MFNHLRSALWSKDVHSAALKCRVDVPGRPAIYIPSVRPEGAQQGKTVPGVSCDADLRAWWP